MVKAAITGIAPFFIVRNVPAALAFYHDRLGFHITFQGPEPDDIFFGIVEPGAAMIMLKAVGVDPMPNYTREVKKGARGGTLTSMFPIPMRWQPNSRRVTWSSRSRSRTTRTGCADSQSWMPADTFCSSVVLFHEFHLGVPIWCARVATE